MEFEGEDWTVRTQEGWSPVPTPSRCSCPRCHPGYCASPASTPMAVLWMATAAAIEEHIAPGSRQPPRRRGGRHHGSSPASRWPCTTTRTRRAGPWPPVPSSTPTGRTTSASWRSGGRADPPPPSSATSGGRGATPVPVRRGRDRGLRLRRTGRSDLGLRPSHGSPTKAGRHERHPRLVGAPDRHRHRWWIRHRPRHQQAPGCRRSGRRRSTGTAAQPAAASAIEGTRAGDRPDRRRHRPARHRRGGHRGAGCPRRGDDPRQQRGRRRSRKFLEISSESYQRVVGVNLTGTFDCCQAVAPDMIAARWGRIVNIASSSAQTGNAPDALRRVQGGGDRPHPFAGQGARTQGHHRQHPVPGVRRHPDAALERGGRVPRTGVETHEKTTPVGRVGRPEDMLAACVPGPRQRATSPGRSSA